MKWAALESKMLAAAAYDDLKLDLPPVLRQTVKTQNPLNGELSHGVVA